MLDQSGWRCDELSTRRSTSPAPIAFLVWLFVRHRDHYPRWRNAIAIVTGFCLVIRFVRVAPPRFLPDLGYIDLASVYGMSVYGPSVRWCRSVRGDAVDPRAWAAGLVRIIAPAEQMAGVFGLQVVLTCSPYRPRQPLVARRDRAIALLGVPWRSHLRRRAIDARRRPTSYRVRPPRPERSFSDEDVESRTPCASGSAKAVPR